MEKEEIKELLKQAANQIETTTLTAIEWEGLIDGSKQMRANEDAQIYQHLWQAFEGLFSPDEFETYMDPQGHKKTIDIGRHKLDVVVVHREKTLEKLKGVDVFYNLLGWKALAFQHKKRSRDGAFDFGRKDKEQRNKIQNLCDACKLPQKFRNNTSYIRPHCASIYIIGDYRRGIRHSVSACQIETYRDIYRNKTDLSAFSQALPQPTDLETVDKMFLQCIVGRCLEKEKDKQYLESIQDAFLTQPDLLIKAKLNRKLRRLKR